MRIEWERNTLERGIPRGVKDAISEVFDFACSPVIAAAIRGLATLEKTWEKTTCCRRRSRSLQKL
jgi:hypothetical protein